MSVYTPPSGKLTSEKWLRDYADSLNLTYRDLIDGAHDWLRSGEWLCQGGKLRANEQATVLDGDYGHRHATRQSIRRQARKLLYLLVLK